MPRDVRNFWIEINVDGRKSKVACGPRGADGEFDLTVQLRENGCISDKCLCVRGTYMDGKLRLTADLEGCIPASDEELVIETTR